jgi:hypothetical protein
VWWIWWIYFSGKNFVGTERVQAMYLCWTWSWKCPKCNFL